LASWALVRGENGQQQSLAGGEKKIFLRKFKKERA